jgi:two-component system, NtrC family, nitrogen regulation response regulator GlnG
MTTVLLVDDEKLIQRSLEKTLLRAGFDVLTASDCAAGRDVFSQNADAVDIAVLDLNMPGFDGMPKNDAGFDLLEELKKKKADLPVIILTAYDEVNKAKDAVSKGANAFFVKGREQGLVELVQKILSAKTNRQTAKLLKKKRGTYDKRYSTTCQIDESRRACRP